ncbi:MAG: hydroxypyruvate isomerase [Pseudomonadota bacterium]|nr:hydroxypyruvate isomerase [Pseudomonadota bacterium]
MPRFSANLSLLFNEVEFLDRFEAAARAGFEGVEYLFPYAWPAEELAERLSRHGLTQALFNLPPGDWEAGERGIAALPGRESEFQDSVGTAIAYAKALGCRRVHAMAGLVAEGADRERMQETYLNNLRFAAAACAGHGIRLLIEAINTRDMPGYFLNHSWQARRIIEAVGGDNLFFQYDFYHMQIMEGNLAATVAANWDIIGHFQLAGVPGRHEPDNGEIHYPFLFELLDTKGYDGWIGCEYRPRTTTLEGLGWGRAYGIGT